MKHLSLKKRHSQGSSETSGRSAVNGGIVDLANKLDYLNRCFLKNVSPKSPHSTTAAMDDYFRVSFGTSESGFNIGLINNPYAIIATGGYGRKEICRQPDISILFIFKNTIPEDAAGLIRDIVYPLWDLGFIINHTTKTVKECIHDAAKDYGYLSSLTDSRFICGASLLYSDLMKQLRDKVLFNKKKEVVEWLYRRDNNRHIKYGSAPYLTEPDLVHCSGGLKDYHSIMSTTRILSGPLDPKELEYLGYMSWKDYEALETALNFLRRVVRFLNIFTGRASSRLLQKYLATVAGFMGYKTRKGCHASEDFLSDLAFHMTLLCEVYHRFYMTVAPELFTNTQSVKPDKTTAIKWLSISKGMIEFKSSVKLKKHPGLLLDIYSESDRFNTPLSPEATLLARELLFLADDSFVSSKPNQEKFEALLFLTPEDSKIPFRILENGIISAFIPEFNAMMNRKRIGHYHIHTLCKHLLLTVAHIKKILGETSGEYSGIQQTSLSDRDRSALLWAAFLHRVDSINPEKGSTETVSEILQRFGKSSGFIDRVTWIIKSRHLLGKAVTLRDIHDRDTILHCLSKIPCHESLHLLYIFTIARLNATGPAAWNKFIDYDLRRLYQKCIVDQINGSSSMSGGEKKMDIVKHSRPGWEPDEMIINAPGLLDTRYLEAFSTDDISSHLNMAERTGNKDVSISINRSGNSRHVTMVTSGITCPEASALGVFILHSVDVYDCRIYNWSPSKTVLVFRVNTPGETLFEAEKWHTVEIRLRECLTNEASLKHSCVRLQLESSTPVKGYGPGTPVIGITKLPNAGYHTIEVAGTISGSILVNAIRQIRAAGFTLMFFRITEGSSGPLFIGHITKADGGILSKKETKKLRTEINNAFKHK